MASPIAPTSTLVVDLADPEAADPALVGTKAATLMRLAAAGFRVPDGYILTTEAFRRVSAGLSAADPAATLAVAMPAGVEEAVLQVGSTLDDQLLAVRSSSAAEDLADASYAGQYTSVLGVRGPEALVAAVRECWASAYGVHAAAYRATHGSDGASMAVLVQRQIEPRAAGIAFSADPVSGDRTVVIINAVTGLGDELAAGNVTPEAWRASGDGPHRVSDTNGVLSEADAAAIARLAREAEAEAGCPQDVEWALDAQGLWLLQARPITALPAPEVTPVPVPVEVPDGYWERDASHGPAPFSPFGRTTIYPIANAVTPTLFTEYGMLAERLVLTDIGGWHYIRTVPIGGKDRKPPPAPLMALMVRLHPAMRQRTKAAREVVRSGKATRIIERWWTEWQPALMRRADDILAVDRPSLTDDELLAHVEAVLDHTRNGIRSHMFVLGASMIEAYPLIATCRELLGWDVVTTLDLVTGLSFRSTEPARELARLAGRFRDNPSALAELGSIDDGTLDRLTTIDPQLAKDLDVYRWSYGARGLGRDPADPTIADRPELMLHMIADQLRAGFDPTASDQANERRRTEAQERARALLDGRSDADRQRFEQVLSRAERAYPLREDNVFVALQAPVGLLRYAAIEVGHRLADRGQIDRPEDVFFLEYPEARDALAAGADQHATVRLRMGERAWVLDHPGPASYGTPPGPPPSLDILPADAREVTQAFLTFMGLAIDPGIAGASTEHGLRGVAGSPGRFTGPARIVMDESQFDKIQAGDVVVCPATQPTWSMVFPVMGAVVTDSGGILSHSAIIAREYRIPAVVATRSGTSILRDGQLVTVDGSTGLVELVER